MSEKTKTMKNLKLPIEKKAYEIDLNKLDEGYLSSEIYCHAKNINEAKGYLLSKVRFDEWKLRSTGEELTYLNIPVKRVKELDIVRFEDKPIQRNFIEQMLDERSRKSELDEIQNNPNIKYCYIKKGSYYRPNSCGYTSYRHEAGVYPKDEAISHARSVREITLEWIDKEEHNKMIVSKIAELESRLIV